MKDPMSYVKDEPTPCGKCERPITVADPEWDDLCHRCARQDRISERRKAHAAKYPNAGERFRAAGGAPRQTAQEIELQRLIRDLSEHGADPYLGRWQAMLRQASNAAYALGRLHQAERGVKFAMDPELVTIDAAYCALEAEDIMAEIDEYLDDRKAGEP